MTSAMRSKGFNWAPLYRAMQNAAVDTIIEPTPLPKKYLRDPYYGEIVGGLGAQIKEMKAWAREEVRSSDTFFSSDAEYYFSEDEDDNPSCFYEAIEQAIIEYQNAIEDYTGDKWNFGPGEGFSLAPRFSYPDEKVCERIGKKCCPLYVKALAAKDRAYARDVAKRRKERAGKRRK